MQYSRKALEVASRFVNFNPRCTCTQLALNFLSFLRNQLQANVVLGLSIDLNNYLISNAPLKLDDLKKHLTFEDLQILQNFIQLNLSQFNLMFGLITNDIQSAEEFTEYFIGFLRA